MSTTKSENPNEKVNHPRHYNAHESGVETIELIEHLPCNLANAVKYLWRCGLKSTETPLRDLKSALWYTQREKNRLRVFELGKNYHPVATDIVWRALAARVIDTEKNDRGLTVLGTYLGFLLDHEMDGMIGAIRFAIGLVVEADVATSPTASIDLKHALDEANNQLHRILKTAPLAQPEQGPSLNSQIDRLADYILNHCPGEPSQNQGAVDTAIRIIGGHHGQMAEALASFEKENATIRRVLGEEVARVTKQRDDNLTLLGCGIDPATGQMFSTTTRQIAQLTEQRDKLWRLLDNIDTLDDSCRSDCASFRKHTYIEQRKRFAVFTPSADKEIVACDRVFEPNDFIEKQPPPVTAAQEDAAADRAHDPWRRRDMFRLIPAEVTIGAAMESIEALGADKRLTKAILLLRQASDHVADFVDGVESRP
jgi:hypothetical protein